MGKRVSELPSITTLGDNDVVIANHIDTSQQEPTTTTSKITVSYLKQTLGINGKVDTSSVGVAGGVAELDNNGKIPSTQLPSYVDDVLEYASLSAFPATGETGKIYVALDTNKTYRWSGTAYVEISASLALGETSSTAYRGDRGKTAYDHSQATSGNPHGVTKSDVGLGNVANTGDSDTPVSGGTTKFTTGGAYTELNKKADKVTGGATGNLAGLDASGNLTDSGSKPADFAASSHTHAAMTGAGASTAGVAGFVPAPAAGDQNKVLSGAGTWVPQNSSGVSSFNSRTGAVTPAAGDYNANQVGAHGLYGITMLASNANLNDYIYPTYKGEYYYNIAGHSISNMPTGLSGKPFRLIVESLGDSIGDTATGTGELDITYANCTLQTLIVTNLNNSLEVKTYRRRGYNSGTQSPTWSDWVSYEDQIAALNSGIIDLFGTVNDFTVRDNYITNNNLDFFAYKYLDVVSYNGGVMTYISSTPIDAISRALTDVSWSSSADKRMNIQNSPFPINLQLKDSTYTISSHKIMLDGAGSVTTPYKLFCYVRR